MSSDESKKSDNGVEGPIYESDYLYYGSDDSVSDDQKQLAEQLLLYESVKLTNEYIARQKPLISMKSVAAIPTRVHDSRLQYLLETLPKSVLTEILGMVLEHEQPWFAGKRHYCCTNKIFN